MLLRECCVKMTCDNRQQHEQVQDYKLVQKCKTIPPNYSPLLKYLHYSLPLSPYLISQRTWEVRPAVFIIKFALLLQGRREHLRKWVKMKCPPSLDGYQLLRTSRDLLNSGAFNHRSTSTLHPKQWTTKNWIIVCYRHKISGKFEAQETQVSPVWTAVHRMQNRQVSSVANSC